MKKIISALLAASLLVVPVAASAHDHDRYEHRDRSNGVLPFIAGAVVGGIIVDSARKAVSYTHLTLPTNREV